MILADLRSRLTESDHKLVVSVLAQGSRVKRDRAEKLLSEGELDALLDDPQLLDRLVNAQSMLHPSPALFYYVAVRHLLLKVGADDRELADYLAAMLLEFGRRDRAWRVSWNDDHQHRYLIDILSDLETATGERRFRVMAHLGNYALWISGVFPDYIQARRDRRGGPDVSYYQAMGRQGYSMAAEHDMAEPLGLAPVLRSAAERFALVRTALNRLSDQFIFPGRYSADRVIREVSFPS